MDYVQLGASAVKVSRICLGTMNFGNSTPEAEAIRIIHKALDQGINFVDTADCYSAGGAEIIVGKALKDRRDSVVLTSKCWAPMGKGPNDGGGSRYHIMQACEASLKRLQTDHLDLFLIHRAPKEWPGTPVEETLSAMTDLVRQGKVRYIGTSAFNAWRLVEAQWTSRMRNFERFCNEQTNYNIMTRFVETDVLRVCERYGIGVTVWSPLNWGLLSGKYRRGQAAPKDSRGATQNKPMYDFTTPEGKESMETIEKLIPLAEERGLTLAQFSLAWLLKNPRVTSIVCGPRLMSHLEENLKALDVELDDAAMRAVDEIAPPPARQGEWW